MVHGVVGAMAGRILSGVFCGGLGGITLRFNKLAVLNDYLIARFGVYLKILNLKV